MTARCQFEPLAFAKVDTSTLRSVLPYRTIDSDLIFINQHSIGFGMRLYLTPMLDVSWVFALLRDYAWRYPNIVCTLNFYTYHSHKSCLLFMSADPSLRPQLLKIRCYAERYLRRAFIAHQRLSGCDFLVIMRSLLSPTLHHPTLPNLIDIRNQSFQNIIPGPGTHYFLTENHLEVNTLDAYAHQQSCCMLLLRGQLARLMQEERTQFFDWLWQDSFPMQNWMLNINLAVNSLESCDYGHYRLLLIDYSPVIYQQLGKILTFHKQIGIRLQLCVDPWYAFLEMLPWMQRQDLCRMRF